MIGKTANEHHPHEDYIMLSAYSFFRGNYMTVSGSRVLLRNLCGTPEFVPDFWNISEPIDKLFQPSDLDSVIYGAMVPAEKAAGRHIRTLTFFTRTRTPRYQLSIDLRLGPVQWGSTHNRIAIQFEESGTGGKARLAEYLLSSVLPEFPDYAKIVESSLEEPERLNEFRRTFSGEELRESLAKRPVTLPFGPYGLIENIYWFNYFGRVYADFIGREKLRAAGWARAEDIGGGLACYASANLDDASFQEKRSRIATKLEEFLWAPGCTAENKRIPKFDFSAQSEALEKRRAH